jgi:YidC/Oxa1 family membrane protein insertase
MANDNRNLILAIILSVTVLLGWNALYGVPEMQRQKDVAASAKNISSAKTVSSAQGSGNGQNTATNSGPVPVPGGEQLPQGNVSSSPPVQQTRNAALAAQPRINIDTPRLSGSINLRGGRIDDVALKTYRETVDAHSAQIVLFSPKGSPKPYYAEFGWVGQNVQGLPNAETLWSADKPRLSPGEPVTLTFDNGQGLVFRRVVSIDEKYLFTIEDRIENSSSTSVNLFAYGLVARHGKPETLGYYVLHEGMIGVAGDQGLQEYTYANLEKEPFLSPNVRGKSWKALQGGFFGITDKYWAASIIPDQTAPFEGRYTVSSGDAGPIFQSDILGEMRAVAPGSSITSVKRLFAGAKEVAAVDGYEKAHAIKRFDLLIDWGWFYFITKPLFYVLDYFYRLFGNFGVSILIVTVLIKLAFFPLANKSYASMAKMKAVQPEMLAIRDRFGDDKLKQQQALMDLYRKEKINPLAGCWPVLVQIPVFFALYKVLFVTIEMRHAPFFGWVKDLAAPDPTSIFNLFGLLPFGLPAFLLVGVWPILMGITMFVQMKMNPEPPDPIQKAVFTWMPFLFTFMLATFPAGLVIYWTWNNFLSILQQWTIMKKNGVKVELFDNLKGMMAKKN